MFPKRFKASSQGRLRDREERFRTTVDNAPLGISHTDKQGRWLYVNRRFCEIVGYTEDELLERSFADITDPDHLDENRRLDEKLFSGEIDRYSLEKQYIHKNGDPIWVNLTVSLVRDRDGNPAYSIAIVEDITERKLQTQALRTAEKLLAAGKLAANIAHELNNPLSGMLNLVYLLKADPGLKGSSRELVDELDSQLRRVSEVTQRALTFYRETTTPELVEVGVLVNEVLRVFESRLKSSEIEVRVISDCSAPIQGFPGELRHTIANFVANAIDELEKQPPGCRMLVVAVRKGFDWRNPHAKGVRLSFADTGSGIPRKSWPTLYDPFFTTKGGGASGLGLWVAKGIIEKHGGSVRFRTRSSGPHRGTIFSIFLPRAPSRRAEVLADQLASQIGRELLRNGSAS